MTDTFAYLPIPRAAWDYIADAMEQAGYGDHMITEIDGQLTVAVPLYGIAVVPAGDHDTFVNSGRLSDLLVQAGEDAFYAGYKAAQEGVPMGRAWGGYEVPEDIMELQNNL